MKHVKAVATLASEINAVILKIQTRQTAYISEDRVLLRLMRATGLGVYDSIVTQAIEEGEIIFEPVVGKLGISNITSWEYDYGRFKMLAQMIANGTAKATFTDFSSFTVDQLIAYTLLYINSNITPNKERCHALMKNLRNWPNIIFMKALKTALDEDATLYNYSVNSCRKLIAKTALAVIRKTEYWGLFTKNNQFKYQLMMKATGLQVTPGTVDKNFLMPILLNIYAFVTAIYSYEHRAMLIRDIKVSEYLSIDTLNEFLMASSYVKNYFRELDLANLNMVRVYGDLTVLKTCRENSITIAATTIGAIYNSAICSEWNPLFQSVDTLIENFYEDISEI